LSQLHDSCPVIVADVGSDGLDTPC